jgi:hypothetical protein
VPLGYDANERTLVINPAEAETVRRIFALCRIFALYREPRVRAPGQGGGRPSRASDEMQQSPIQQ